MEIIFQITVRSIKNPEHLKRMFSLYTHQGQLELNLQHAVG